jgi:hypothetical protein
LRSSSAFPYRLFESVQFPETIEDAQNYTINITNYKKENIAKNIEVNRSINEKEWLSDSIKNDIFRRVVSTIISYPKDNKFDYESVDKTLIDLSLLADSFDIPILFAGQNPLKRILREAKYNNEIAQLYGISFRDGFGENYLCHIGEIEAYSIRMVGESFSLLFSKSILSTITFPKAAENEYVTINFTENTDDKMTGELSLSYNMKV